MAHTFAHGYALLIGVTENQVARWALPDVGKDITALAEVLAHPERCAYPAENIQTIVGPAVTREGILAGLAWLEERLHADTGGDATASGNATAVIYYTGHGWRDTASSPTVYYLIPYDVRENAIPARSLRAEDFATAIAALQPQRLLVLLDCCHAGGMGVKELAPLVDVTATGFVSAAIPPGLLLTGEKALAAAAGSKGLEQLAQGTGRAVLSSSQGAQKSYIRRDRKMSIFTYHLIEALTGHAQPAEGATEVLVSDVMGHVWRRVPASARADAGQDQQPDFQVSGNFPVALLLGGKGLSKGVTPPDPLQPLPVPPSAVAQTMIGAGVQVGRDQTIQGDLVLGDKIGRQVKTGGGAYIEGDVRTGGGDFIGRDQIVTTGPVATGGSAVNTGGGVAFVGDGNTVITGKVGGDVLVGRHVTKTGGGQAEFLALLEQISEQLAALASPADRAEAATELANAAELAQCATPSGGRITRALENVREILASSAGATSAAVALGGLVIKAIQMAQSLFR